MKNLILFLVLVSMSIFNSLEIAAQEKNVSESWRFNSASFTTGVTSLTKGNTLSASFSKDRSLLVLDYNKELGEFLYFYSPIKQISFGGSGGFFKNVPWFGPIASFNLVKGHIKTLHWIGWSLGDPEKRNTSEEMLFCFSYQQISVNYNGFEAYYALQHYQDFPEEHIFGIKKDFQLNENFSVPASGGYMLNADNLIWSIGLSYNVK